MNDVGTEGHGVPLAKGLRASGFNPVRCARNASPEDIVLSAGVNTDHGPHVMIVGHHHHAWRPHHIEDCKRIRMEELADFSALRLTEPLRTAAGSDIARARTSRISL